MDAIELIRNAGSATDALSALATYVSSLPELSVIPDWCLRLPIEGEADLFQRAAILLAAVDLTSRTLRYRECGALKQVLRAFAAAAARLRRP